MTRARDDVRGLSVADPGSEAEIRFVDNALPPLAADDYVAQVQQAVQPTRPGDFVPPQPYQSWQRFQVAGPHFALGATDVHSVYPPANSESSYSTTLPHVVLGRRGLPWEISVGGLRSGPLVTPWLALLLLTPSQIVLPEGARVSGPTRRQTVALADYLRPPGKTVGPDPASVPIDEWEHEYADLSCVVVDVERTAFETVAPAAAELPYLAHARWVDTQHQEVLGVDDDGWFSVVIGNRLPTTPGVYVAHLVSLEGFMSYLPPDGRGLPADAPAVRLLSLAAWTFNNLAPAGDFTTLMQNLDIDVLRLDPTSIDGGGDGERFAQSALSRGYVGVTYQLRLGAETTGWYRGPLLPVEMERNLQPLFESGESALVYDPDTGMFDISYAVAWQTGRLLALAQRQFVVTLLRWVRAGHALAQLLAERLALFQSIAPGEDSADGFGSLLAPMAVRELNKRYLARAFDREGRLGPAADPSGLRGQLHRLRGLLSPGDQASALEDGADPEAAIVAHVRGGS